MTDEVRMLELDFELESHDEQADLEHSAAAVERPCPLSRAWTTRMPRSPARPG